MKCQMVMRQRPANGSDVQCFGREKAQQVQSFHRSFPGYAPTPLAELPQTAAALGLGGLSEAMARVFIKVVFIVGLAFFAFGLIGERRAA